jgi:hypothetical protein
LNAPNCACAGGIGRREAAPKIDIIYETDLQWRRRSFMVA